MNKELMRAPQRPSKVDAYIESYPTEVQTRLREMRRCLAQAAPGAEESLKWGKPAISHGRILFAYGAFKDHISLFPTPGVVRAFAARLSAFTTSSSTIQFPLDRSLPRALIRKIALFRVRECREKDAKWRKIPR